MEYNTVVTVQTPLAPHCIISALISSRSVSFFLTTSPVLLVRADRKNNRLVFVQDQVRQRFGVVSARSVLSGRYDCAYAYLFRGHALRALLIFLLTSELVGRRRTVLGKRLRQIGQNMKDSKVAGKVVELKYLN